MRRSPSPGCLPSWEPGWPGEGKGAPRGCGRLTLARPLIGQQLVALPAAALEAAHGVPAEVVAAPVVDQALIDVCRAGRVGRGGEESGLGSPGAGRTEARSRPSLTARCPPGDCFGSPAGPRKGAWLTAVAGGRRGDPPSPWGLGEPGMCVQEGAGNLCLLCPARQQGRCPPRPSIPGR